jgi:predicted Zn-dependent peptidase
LITDAELQKVINRTESVITFEDMGVMSRANSLAMYELLGDAELMNTEFSKYQEVTVQDIQQYAQQIFDDKNSSTIHYYSKN